MFKGLSNLASLMANAGQIQEQAEEMQARLRERRVEANAGGGMVRVEMSGDQKVTSIQIEQSLFDSGDKEMLEDLVLSATNQALDLAKQAAAEEMSGMASGLGIPGLGDALAKFGNGNT
ncbi:YbaB/EbfC family nucleoid-associated protein [Thalassoglobus sp. JC818]|uniref:YbaB/EbfC family nucleoid-associated protein n=1 Tax=Thalassoglobus sp. JC818 TaxID=3232136 RepID=UPI003459BB99